MSSQACVSQTDVPNTCASRPSGAHSVERIPRTYPHSRELYDACTASWFLSFSVCWFLGRVLRPFGYCFRRPFVFWMLVWALGSSASFLWICPRFIGLLVSLCVWRCVAYSFLCVLGSVDSVLARLLIPLCVGFLVPLVPFVLHVFVVFVSSFD